MKRREEGVIQRDVGKERGEEGKYEKGEGGINEKMGWSCNSGGRGG